MGARARILILRTLGLGAFWGGLHAWFVSGLGKGRG